MNIKSEINADFLDEAENQIFDILLTQRLAYNDRWANNPLFLKITPLLRKFGLAASLLGVLLCIFSIVVSVHWQLCSAGPFVFILFFILFGIIFYLLPKFDEKIKVAIRNIAFRSCGRLAKKCVVKGRKEAPYIAEYDIKGGCIMYYREKGGKLKFAWMRKLKGVAIQSDSATLIFRKWTSIGPTIIILHNDRESVKNALSQQSIACKLFSEL